MDAKFKHLDYIQTAIGRMATNSFLFKGWAITIATGLSAFGAADTKVALLVIALGTTLLFWGLDGYYLWLGAASSRFTIGWRRRMKTRSTSPWQLISRMPRERG